MDPHKVAWFRPNPEEEDYTNIPAQELPAKSTFTVQNFIIHLTEEDVEDARLRKLEKENSKPGLFPACLIPMNQNKTRTSHSG